MTESEILRTCASIAKNGEMYGVNMYRYSEERKRALCFSLKKTGKLIQGETYNKLFHFYRPEDIKVIEYAKIRHEKNMKKVYAQNVIWHNKQAENHPCLRDYHLEEAAKNMELSR